MIAQKSIDLIFEDDETCEPVKLKASDIDAHHGKFVDTQTNENVGLQGKSEGTTVDLSGAKCQSAKGLPLEMSAVLLGNLSPENFLISNGVNVTAFYLHADLRKKDVFTAHVGPQF